MSTNTTTESPEAAFDRWWQSEHGEAVATLADVRAALRLAFKEGWRVAGEREQTTVYFDLGPPGPR